MKAVKLYGANFSPPEITWVSCAASPYDAGVIQRELLNNPPVPFGMRVHELRSHISIGVLSRLIEAVDARQEALDDYQSAERHPTHPPHLPNP